MSNSTSDEHPSFLSVLGGQEAAPSERLLIPVSSFPGKANFLQAGYLFILQHILHFIHSPSFPGKYCR